MVMTIILFVILSALYPWHSPLPYSLTVSIPPSMIWHTRHMCVIASSKHHLNSEPHCNNVCLGKVRHLRPVAVHNCVIYLRDLFGIDGWGCVRFRIVHNNKAIIATLGCKPILLQSLYAILKSRTFCRARWRVKQSTVCIIRNVIALSAEHGMVSRFQAEQYDMVNQFKLKHDTIRIFDMLNYLFSTKRVVFLMQ